MKAYRFLIFIFLIAVGSTAIFTSCKYDVAEPMWEKEFVVPPTPKVTKVEPSVAAAGVNTIKIVGENFIGTSDTCIVYFDRVVADVISKSQTEIVVRRPNLVKDSSLIKVVPNKALTVAKYGPYKLESVINKYGSFLDNLPLATISVDKNESIYVTETTSKNVYKVTSGGVKTMLGVATRSPIDAKIGSDGRLYLTENNRAVDVVDPVAGGVKQWMRMPPGYVVQYCDFDTQGYFYAAGSQTDVVTVGKDGVIISYPNGDYGNGDYLESDVITLKTYNGYLYVAVTTGTDPVKIYRNKLNSDGTLQKKELVADFASSKEFASASLKAISFSATGTMYLAIDSKASILIVDTVTKKLDYFYKGIVFPYCKHFAWGTGNYLYMISGDTAAPQEWTVYRVNMGAKGIQ